MERPSLLGLVVHGWVGAIVFASTLLAGCNHSIIEDSSAFAATSGQATVILGTVDQGYRVGWANYYLERGSSLPALHLFFTNPAQYAIGDCVGGQLTTGSVSQPGDVSVDLSPLMTELNSDNFCLLKVEAVEYWGDNHRPIPLLGGFFIEILTPGYIQLPPRDQIAFCYKFGRTTAGRTLMETCTQ